MSITRIKQTGLPPANAHWSYGPAWMRRVSRKTAAALCAGYPLPQMGHETIVAVAPDGWGGKNRLVVQNVGGDFYVASTDAPVDQWATVFRVEVSE
ncbi:hypothetical protein [Achromobacter aegrifaciens]